MVDISNHYTGHARNLMLECGTSAFSGTGLTVEIPCGLNELRMAVVTPKQTVNSREKYYCDLVSAGTVTVGRKVDTKKVSFSAYEGQMASNNLSAMPLMIAQFDMILTEVEWFHGTAFGGGTPTFQLGNADDNDAYIVAELITTPTTNNKTSTFITFASHPSDGDVLIVKTVGGGTSAPSNCVISISYQTPTSDLAFSYILFGI